MDAFWDTINAQLDQIEREKTDTYEGLAAIMPPVEGVSSAGAFFGGSGGGRSLYSALYRAGWRSTWAAADYYYVAKHQETDEVITYIEGDIYAGDRTKG